MGVLGATTTREPGGSSIIPHPGCVKYTHAYTYTLSIFLNIIPHHLQVDAGPQQRLVEGEAVRHQRVSDARRDLDLS